MSARRIVTVTVTHTATHMIVVPAGSRVVERQGQKGKYHELHFP